VVVNAGEEVAEPLRKRKWTDMNVLETIVWEIKLLEWCCSMTMDFIFLATIASSSPTSNIKIEAVPHKKGTDERTYNWV
jgi:hypothetical protein